MSSPSDDEFHTFMTGRWPSLVRTAYLLTGGHHDAEDLAQAALARAYVKWDRVRRSDDRAAYVRKIMIHVHADGFRRRTVREWFTSRLPETAVADRTDQVAHRGALVDALAGLPLRQRTAAVLRYFEDMTPAQIAAAMGTREGTVRGQITRALAKLRDDGVLAARTGSPQESRTHPSDPVALKGRPR